MTTTEWPAPGWTSPDVDVAAFLDAFDQLSAGENPDPAGTFAPQLLVLDADRVMPLNPAGLAAGLPARRRIFDDAGVGAISRIEATQLRLDERHVLVHGRWRAERATGSLILSSTFLLRRQPPGYLVVVYLNHTDLTTALRSGPD